MELLFRSQNLYSVCMSWRNVFIKPKRQILIFMSSPFGVWWDAAHFFLVNRSIGQSVNFAYFTAAYAMTIVENGVAAKKEIIAEGYDLVQG